MRCDACARAAERNSEEAHQRAKPAQRTTDSECVRPVRARRARCAVPQARGARRRTVDGRRRAVLPAAMHRRDARHDAPHHCEHAVLPRRCRAVRHRAVRGGGGGQTRTCSRKSCTTGATPTPRASSCTGKSKVSGSMSSGDLRSPYFLRSACLQPHSITYAMFWRTEMASDPSMLQLLNCIQNSCA